MARGDFAVIVVLHGGYAEAVRFQRGFVVFVKFHNFACCRVERLLYFLFGCY